MCRTLGFMVGVLAAGLAGSAGAGDPLPTDAGNSVVVEKRVPPDVRGSFPTPANFPATDLPRAKSRGPYQPLYLTYVPADVDPRFGYVMTPQRVLRTDWRVPPPRLVVPRYGPPIGEPR